LISFFSKIVKIGGSKYITISKLIKKRDWQNVKVTIIKSTARFFIIKVEKKQ